MIRLNSIDNMSLFRIIRKLPNGSDGFFLFKVGDRLDSSTSEKNRDIFNQKLFKCILSRYSAMIISDLELIKLIEIILKKSTDGTKDIYIIYDVDAAVDMGLFHKNQSLIETGIYTEGKDFYYKSNLIFRRISKYSTSGETFYEYVPYIKEESDDTEMEAF